jgi:CRP/FNR family transcriptional regulator, cyclic AMP receptor protein
MSVPSDSLPDYFSDLTPLGVRRQYRAQSVILKEGDPGDAMYLLLAGEARSYSEAINGKVIAYNTIKTGQYFGEMALDGGNRSASVQAVTDCECLLVANAQVLAYASQHPAFASHLLHTVIHRARMATEAAKSMALSDVYERLWRVMHQEFEVNEGICTLTHLDMAGRIGASREMVSKLIKDLERGGYVEALQRRQIRLIQKIPMRW